MWAVGVLAFELLVGRAPFEVKDERDTAFRIMFGSHTCPPIVSVDASSFINAVRRGPEDKAPQMMSVWGPYLLSWACYVFGLSIDLCQQHRNHGKTVSCQKSPDRP